MPATGGNRKPRGPTSTGRSADIRLQRKIGDTAAHDPARPSRPGRQRPATPLVRPVVTAAHLIASPAPGTSAGAAQPYDRGDGAAGEGAASNGAASDGAAGDGAASNGAASDGAADVVHTPRLRECDGCGLLQRLPPLPAHAVARCSRCGTVLRRRRADPTVRPLALASPGCCLLVDRRLVCRSSTCASAAYERMTTLVTGAHEMRVYGEVPVALVVLLDHAHRADAAAGRHSSGCCSTCGRDAAPFYLAGLFRWVERLRPWAMVEVFLLGVFVAYTKLVDLAQVDVGPALYALGGLMLVTAAVDAHAGPGGGVAPACTAATRRSPRGAAAGTRPGRSAATCCQLVNAAGQADCSRCGGRLHRRKPDSISPHLGVARRPRPCSTSRPTAARC